jgi:imidazolonepropionase-like amidohydrolase
MIKTFIHIVIILFLSSLAFGQNSSKILLVDGYLHDGKGQTMESALIAIENGKISFIKNSLAHTYEKEEWDTIINLQGRHIYPGFVAPNTTLGITEIDAVRATRDYNEVGEYNPHIRSQIAFNVESKVVTTVRTNGVLIAQPTPRGGAISGTSSIMKLDGWNWEDATINAGDGIHVNWPRSPGRPSRWRKDSDESAEEKYTKEKTEMYEFFEMASVYAKTSRHGDYFDRRLDAMRACFKGKKRVFFHANELQQIEDIIEFSKEFKLKFPVIVGGYDAHLIGRKLADAKIPVMLFRTHRLPHYESDPVDLPYKIPSLLSEFGVKFCIQNAGGMEAMNGRNIPFLAGTAATYGLSEEDAISSVSLWSCEILGIDKDYGSIESGKSATLFVSDGNALDMRSNNLFLALIDGKFMSLENSQSKLYKKYKTKYQND